MTATKGTVRSTESGRLTSRGAATRARIVEAAADLVFERGVSGTSLDDLLSVSSTSKSQLYHYFADKDALIRAVIVRQTERVLGWQEPHLRRLDSMTGLRDWCRAVVAVAQLRHGVGGCPVGSLASELADSSEHSRILLAHGFRTWEARVESGLRAMQASGELRADAVPADLAATIMAALQGGLLLAQTTRDTRDLRLGLDRALEHVGRHVTEPG